MLPLLKSDRKPQKCQITCSTLPTFIDPLQPPQKSAPFNALWALKWCHTVDVLLPAELRDVIKQTEARQLELSRFEKQNGKYAKVIMKLGEVLEGDFFNEYVKKGNVLMLSEGRAGVDTVFELREGILHITVDTPTYERLGLVGKPIRDSGRRHKKNRYTIELNLRLPSMLHGKKGFERLIWACKNVLNHSVTWLFYDCQPTPASTAPAPIEKYHPEWHTLQPTTTEYTNILIPTFNSTTLTQSSTPSHTNSNDDTTYTSDLLEYLSLLALGSSRLQATDSIDPFLSRYTVPSLESTDNMSTGDVVRLRYRGFIPTAYLIRLFILMTKGLDGMKDGKAWGVIQAHGFGGEVVTVLRTPNPSEESKIDGEQDTAIKPDVSEGDGNEAVEKNDEEEDVKMSEEVTAGAEANPTTKPTRDGKADAKSSRKGAMFVCWENAAVL